MKRNVNYMKNLVTKTIELAKLNSPDTKLNYQEFNLFTMVNNILETNRFVFSKKNIEVVNSISDSIELFADSLRIEEVFTNLLNNSIKFSEDGGFISIDASINNNMITVSIKDNGIGITNSQKKRIFNEFYKADESRHDFESSGLGMSICKRIIEKHHGRIWVESDGIGKGSTFHFTIPLRYNDVKRSTIAVNTLVK